MGAIYILWLRELKRYVRSRVQLVVSLGQPALYLVALGFGFGPVFQKAGNGNYLQFMAPGVIGMTVLFSSVFSGIAMLWDRQFGFLKETLVAPVSRLTVMFGRTLGGATVAMIQGTLFLLVCLIAGFRPQHWLAIPAAFIFVGMIALVFAALGTTIGSLIKDMQGFQLVMNFLLLPLFFLSGALYPLNNLPKCAERSHADRSDVLRSGWTQGRADRSVAFQYRSGFGRIAVPRWCFPLHRRLFLFAD